MPLEHQKWQEFKSIIRFHHEQLTS